MQSAAEQRAAHPSRWSRDDIVRWLQEVEGGAYAHCCNNLPSQCCGKDLVRWPQLRFRQLCDDHAQMGDLLYQRFVAARNAANKKREAAVERIRSARS
eukprot:TRINITY_DN43627_c0_g1_i1.p4 TRINITY_DN43627_c0_g1~~TRINITY_DN43627_c0_g1_i1.p4  ORF type:complete len:109 (-),score=9.52 TRINITY_DN43627_c0_g1_i1:177-470(-)